MSHKSDGGRIPRPRGVASQLRSVPSPTITAAAKQTGLPALVPPRPQIDPSVPSFDRTSRLPSLSMAEKGGLHARSNPSRIPSSQGLRSFLPPRATTHPLPSPSGPTVPPNITASLGLSQSSYSVSISSDNTPPPTRSRPRNVLRRKAPTIGQHTAKKQPAVMEDTKPEKLHVIIPADGQSNNGTKKSPNVFENSEQWDHLYSSPSSIQGRSVSSTPDNVSYGPKELASLRTAINTQNLPPPTPGFTSASSPSTRYTGSPWSRTSTPTSLSSYSPGIVQPIKFGSRLRQQSPSHTRLPTFSPRIQQTPSPSNPMGSGELKLPVSTQGADSTTMPTKPRQNGPVTEHHRGRVSAANNDIPQRRTSVRSNLPRKTNGMAEPSRITPGSKSFNGEPRGLLKRGGSEGLSPNTTQVPQRPSRAGTHQLELAPSPVVQSNLSPETLSGHKRCGSVESSLTVDKSPLSANQSAATSVDSLHSRASSRIPSRLPPSQTQSRKPPQTVSKDVKPPSNPVISNKNRRFGLFPKKSKPELDAKPSDEIRSMRKGPAAGTGHEGYGRYGQRGRKTSVGSNSGVRDRSTSTTRSVSKSVSSSKGSDKGRLDMGLDDFLLDRLEPVIIPGGGVDGGALIRTQSEQSSSGLSTTSTMNMVPRFKTSQSPAYSTDSLATSTGTVENIRGSYRRNNSQTELNPSQDAHGGSSSFYSTNDTGSNAVCKTSEADITTHEKPHVGAPKPPLDDRPVNSPRKHEKKSPKKGLGLKWNFFHRSNESTAEKQKEPSSPPVPQLQAAISTVKSHRPVAHYAFVDTDSDPLEDIIHNIEDSPPTEDDEINSPVEVPAALNIRKPCQSILLPSPPKLQGEFARNGPLSSKVYFTRNPFEPSPEQQTEPTGNIEQFPEKRTSRLASVGRIPRVVSRRERQHKPAFQSFSRPFSVAESSSLTALVDRPVEFSPPRPTPEFQTANLQRDRHNPTFDLTQPFGDPTTQSILEFIAGPYSKHEFLTFSPGNDSIISTSSGSESLAAVTAVIPNPGSELNEDEVWGEYDDLIDHVLSPETTRSVSPGEHDAEGKLELATIASRALQAELNGQADKRARSSLIENPALALTPASPQSSNGSVRLRRSRIVSALHSSIAPSSQPSFSDIIKAYCDDLPDSEAPEQTNQATIAPADQHPLYLNSPINPSPSFEICRQRNTVLFDIAERDREGPTAQTNIRSGSLMTSRWLSFGRVLFSPAHNHVKNGEDERILVVDGLGNDDWSFYCALTYPNASVHCLTDGPAPTAMKHPAAWQPPSNHHTIHHASLEDRFPFPRGSFTVTVLRFPAACSESAQNKIISESKRVLRPGGYIEMSVLDLDMVNMGIRTRKAVRQLKERTYLTDPNISLKPASDSIQRMLGYHGFDSLRRCVVRIPTAGVIVRSSASSSSTSSSNPSTMATAITPFTIFPGRSTSSMSTQSKAHGKSSSNDTDLSLGDLLSDPSPSPSNDESIRKIVAKVGRWWYTRCYEIPVLPNGDADLSIWADRKVLRECQKRGTGFRLLIAYAQKPSEKRRTASV